MDYNYNRYAEKVKDIAINNGHRFHLAAVLLRGKSIIRTGTNSTKTHPKYFRTYSNGGVASNLHAETSVLRFSKPGDIIAVMRWNANHELTMAKPCKHCQRFIEEAGIKAVIYSDWNGDFVTMNLEGEK